MKTMLLVLLLVPALVLTAFQYRSSQGGRYNQQYEYEMQDPVPDPPDALIKAEWAFARLRYRSGGDGGGYYRRRSSWGVDSNRADRLFESAIRRLTRIDSRSVEEVIDIDTGPLNDYPWIYAVEVGHWGISPQQAKRLREYFDRGGFLMVDDFHGSYEWRVFMEGLSQIFPDRPVQEIPNDDPIFHIVGDLSDRVQVPGAQFLRSGRTWEQDGVKPKWLGVYDDKGRIQVAICHNMDLGDAWQYADDPDYPEKYATLAIRIAVNYLSYSMTH